MKQDCCSICSYW